LIVFAFLLWPGGGAPARNGMPDTDPIAATRRWVQDFVIGLNLCPFAKRVFDAGRIRFIATEVTAEADLLDVLSGELKRLAAAPRNEIETAILIHPHVLADFRDYNDFLATADLQLKKLNLNGVIQIASFHPHYQFAGTTPDDVTNYTNRSPHPMLHLIREVSITEVAGDPEVPLGIPERNVELLKQLGEATVQGFTRTSTAPSAPGSAAPTPSRSRSTPG
jgi:uncharacterized protein